MRTKDISVRVSPDMFYLIKSIKLLLANQNGMDASFSQASQKVCSLFFEFAQWDTKGSKIINEFKKVKSNASTKSTKF